MNKTNERPKTLSKIFFLQYHDDKLTEDSKLF